jgi:molybdopterin/thiamine biosynthesis adenylyltransferase
MQIVTTQQLPAIAEADAIYVMPPVNPDESYYKLRTERHEGWLTREEQAFIKSATIGIAGLGGMGGPMTPVFLRLGVGTLKLADNDVFDATNINRQFGATRSNIGQSKTFETAKALRAITDDSTLVLYPRGINDAEVDHFLDGCDLVMDVLDFLAVEARILLLKKARERNIPVINANSTGFGTRLFLFTKDSMDIESFLGVTHEEAREFQKKVKSKTATKADKGRMMRAMIMNFTPSPPLYADESENASNVKALRKRMVEQERGPSVVATNLPFASGFATNRAILYLLRNSSVKRRKMRELPLVPGYIYLDSAKLCLEVRTRNINERVRRAVLGKLLERAQKAEAA